MAVLNRGYRVTPVGSSDSHDVARYAVGQGRTYIRCNDTDPGAIDTGQAVNSFVQGRVMISYGLLAQMTVDGKYSSGELATAPGDQIQVDVRVLGPHWTSATKVQLFANGLLIREAEIGARTAELPRGVLWQGGWKLDRPPHDVHLTAIATGPGIEAAYWKTSKPYQPTSPQWSPVVLGCSGAVWIDADGDGRCSPARDYAEQIFHAAGGSLPALTTALKDYDQAVAVQAAHLYRSSGKSLFAPEFRAAAAKAEPHVQAGFRQYLDAWRKNQRARAEAK